MTALLDGKKPAAQIYEQIKSAVVAMQSNQLPVPGLAVVLMGEDPASQIYVANKRRACEAVGFNSYDYDLPKDTSEAELINLINKLNHSPEVHGILVQLPLPTHISTRKIIECIHPEKDVDGFHPYNLGRLIQRNPLLRPCTPYGIIQLLSFYKLSLEKKHAVVIGASTIVGRPMAMELLLTGTTVTICHRQTLSLEQHVRIADLVIVAAGVCDVINSEWLNANQIIIDVGTHRLSNGKLRGDVNFEQAKDKVAWITPVPGGVGPMTIATLLQNTLTATKIQTGSGEMFESL